jgi:hypothetical protein
MRLRLRNAFATALGIVGARLCYWAHKIEVDTRPPCQDCRCPTDDSENCEVCLAQIEQDRMLESEYEAGARAAWEEGGDAG